MRTSLAAALLAGVICAELRADEPFVDPYDVHSAKGTWTLHVEPTTPEGGGHSHCTMKRHGDVKWQAEMPYTPRECVVGESGLVVGYCYNNGYMGWDGQMVVLIIDADGHIIATESHSRNGPLAAVDPPPPGEPRGAGMLVDEDGGGPSRAIIRVMNEDRRAGTSSWWVYSLVDGSKLANLPLAEPQQGDLTFCRELDAAVVPGTGLVAVQWLTYESGKQSACIQLIDPAGKAVWSRRIDGEYSAMPEGWRWWDLVEDKVQQIESNAARAFAVTSYSEQARTQYTVEKRDNGEWTVAESAKKTGVSPVRRREPAKMLKTIDGTLSPLPDITLGAAANPGVIGGVTSMSMDDRGRIGWVRWARGQKPDQRFTLVDRDGKTIVDHGLELPPVKSGVLAMASWIEGDRWLVARTEYGDDHTSSGRAWFLDARTGGLTAIEGFSSGSIKRLVRLPDGGFVVLGSLFGQYTIRDQVTRYDKDGKATSARTEKGYGQGETIQDIAVLGDGTLAILTGVADRCKVVLQRSDESVSATWNLAEINGGVQGVPWDMAYYADIRADKDGGVIAYDSAHENLLHRIDKTGKCWSSIHVRGPKGEKFRLYDAFAVDPDGRIWASDGERLFRCGDDGRADTALGGPPEGSMADPVAVTIDGRGHIFALERGTACVHEFDETGKAVRVMRPEPTDAPTQDALAWIRVESDGRVVSRMSWEGPIITFSADGKRLNVETPAPSWSYKADSESEKASSVGPWRQHRNSVRRVNPDGSVVRIIEHRPDGGWLVDVSCMGVAPDGSLALLCTRAIPGAWMQPAGPGWLCTYGPDGQGRGTVQLPEASAFPSVSYDGKHVLLCDERGLTEFDEPLSDSATRYSLPGEQNFWHVMPQPDRVIAAWDAGTRVIKRWSLPPQNGQPDLPH